MVKRATRRTAWYTAAAKEYTSAIWNRFCTTGIVANETLMDSRPKGMR